MLILLRPYVQTTPQFAEKWGSYSNEKKLSLKLDSIKTPDDLMKLVSSRFNFHGIQIIGLCSITFYTIIHSLFFLLKGKEGISSSTFLPGTTCLLHGKVAGPGLELWIRSPSSLLTDSLGKELQFFLK